MLMKFSLIVLLMTVVICQSASFSDRSVDDDLRNQIKSLTPQQLAELDELLSRKLDDEVSTEVLDRNTRRPYEGIIVKRDALWTTTEVLDCVRRLKHYKNGGSTLDRVSEMLNCYRRLKQSG